MEAKLPKNKFKDLDRCVPEQDLGSRLVKGRRARTTCGTTSHLPSQPSLLEVITCDGVARVISPVVEVPQVQLVAKIVEKKLPQVEYAEKIAAVCREVAPRRCSTSKR